MKRRCKECGAEFETPKGSGLLCSSAHRLAFNNRRIQRGGEMYDLVMSMRFDRGREPENKAWSLLCTIAGRFRDEDKQHRDGRKSWSSPKRMRNINSRIGR